MSADPSVFDELADESADLDGYFSDAELVPEPMYPKLHRSFETAIVITNLPKVPQEKLDRLTQVVTRLASKIGTLATSDTFSGVLMPFDAKTESTLGFCFVEYATMEEANNAVDVLQGYSFDKKHQLRVSAYSRAKQLETIDTEHAFVAPEPAPFQEKPNACKWLEDPNQRDSFIVRYQNETNALWFDAKTDPMLDYDGAREKEAGVAWCEYYCHWSPAGSYLATLVPSKGVILWSGDTYEKTGRFVAPGVKMVLFSPQENYLLTNNQDPSDPAAIKIYHIPTGNLLRAFALYPDNMEQDQAPPPFLWSHDDKYLARMGMGLISIFETPGMRLLDSRSLAAEGISEFQWNPKKNIIVYWVSGVRSSCYLNYVLNTYALNHYTLLNLSTGPRSNQRSRTRRFD
jgi:translation initiation factor 3 subunit B